MQRLDLPFEIFTGKAVPHIQKALAKTADFLPDVLALEYDIGHELGEFAKVIFDHAKTGHLLDAGSQ